MALEVMQKTPTLLMNCEAGSGTRYVCLHYRGVAQALGYPLLDRASNTQTLYLVCRLGLPIAWKFPEWTSGQVQDPIKNPVKK